MASAPDAELGELAWTIALARLVFGPSMNIQAPPNLSPGEARTLIDADMSRARRDEVVDKMAASFILQGYLDWVRIGR